MFIISLHGFLLFCIFYFSTIARSWQISIDSSFILGRFLFGLFKLFLKLFQSLDHLVCCFFWFPLRQRSSVVASSASEIWNLIIVGQLSTTNINIVSLHLFVSTLFFNFYWSRFQPPTINQSTIFIRSNGPRSYLGFCLLQIYSCSYSWKHTFCCGAIIWFSSFNGFNQVHVSSARYDPESISLDKSLQIASIKSPWFHIIIWSATLVLTTIHWWPTFDFCFACFSSAFLAW